MLLRKLTSITATVLILNGTAVSCGGSPNIRLVATYLPQYIASIFTSFSDSVTTSLNRLPAKNAFRPQAIYYDGYLYFVWDETSQATGLNQVHAARIAADGTREALDGGADPTTLPFDNSKVSNNARIAQFNGKIYMTWMETSPAAVANVRVRVYDPATGVKTFVDGNAATTNIKTAVGLVVSQPHLIVINGSLYVIFGELDGSSISQVRVAKYNGDDSNPVWTFIDGGGAAGLNYLSTKAETSHNAFSYNGYLGVSWLESDSSFGGVVQVRAKLYNTDTGVWSWGDGGGTTGLNYNTSKSAGVLRMGSADGETYFAWTEATTGTNQLRVGRYLGPGNGVEHIANNSSDPTQSVLNVGTASNPTHISMMEIDTVLYLLFVESDGATTHQFLNYYDPVTSAWVRITKSSRANEANDYLKFSYNLDLTKSVGFGKLVTAPNKTAYLFWPETNGTANQLIVTSGSP